MVERKRWKLLLGAILITAVLLSAILAIIGDYANNENKKGLVKGSQTIEIYKVGDTIVWKDLKRPGMGGSSKVAREVFQAAINYGSDGLSISVLPGTYTLDGGIHLRSHVRLVGAGENDTVFSSSGRAAISMLETSDVHLSNFSITGSLSLMVGTVGNEVDGFVLKNITSRAGSNISAAFWVLAYGGRVSNVTFEHCSAIDCGTYGFLNSGSGNDSLVDHIEYIGCQAVNCGLTDRPNDYVVGFDLAEQTDASNIAVIDCNASGNWESGFHFEDDGGKTDILFDNCYAFGNGLEKGNVTFGYGFLIGESTTLRNCLAGDNARSGVRIFDRGGVRVPDLIPGERIDLTT